MKSVRILFSIFAVTFAIAGAFASISSTLDAPFFGYNSLNNCVQASINEEGCDKTSGTRCTVQISGSPVAAWDTRVSSTECSVEVYRQP